MTRTLAAFTVGVVVGLALAELARRERLIGRAQSAYFDRVQAPRAERVAFEGMDWTPFDDAMQDIRGGEL